MDENASLEVSTVAEVEETKLMIGILPFWFATMIPSIIITEDGTLFVKQSKTLEKKIGSSFEFPTVSTTS